MRIPLSLIQSYLSKEVSIETVSNTLTLLGIEVDQIINEHPSFARVVVGEVIETAPHPKADKLQIAKVHDGERIHQVVCGASNCRKNLKTAFAPIGALLIDQHQKQFSIEHTSIRDVASEGMLCSASELHLWKDSSGILELPEEWTVGQDLSSLLWDPVFELSFTPNLGHAFSALGIARELSAALNIPFVDQPLSLKEGPNPQTVTVEVKNTKDCPKYACRTIENVHIGPSPFWLQKELLLAGFTPICNVVDVTNYIQMKRGQPLHAFDLDRIEGSFIRVDSSQKDTSFVGLDGVERKIASGALFIEDAKKPIALAGIIGGENSSVRNTTKNIVLEAAFFDPITVRKGSKQAVRTESSLRFEKGVDPNGIEQALNEAASLIAQIAKGSVAKGMIIHSSRSFPPKEIILRIKNIQRLIGIHLSRTEIIDIFTRLQCSVKMISDTELQVSVPTYRFDITEEIDLIEEIVRIYGYNNVPKQAALFHSTEIPHDPVYVFEKELRKRCVALGAQELLTADLIGPKLMKLAEDFLQPDISCLKTIHAKTEEYSILRPSLLPNLLQVIQYNLDQKNFSVNGFEIGRVHFLEKEKNVEIPILSFILTGKSTPQTLGKENDVDFYTLKGLLENLFEGLKIRTLSFHPSSHVSFHPKRQVDIVWNDKSIGSFGEIHPHLLEKMGIRQRVLFAEINIHDLMHLHHPHSLFTAIPTLPSSERDLTISLPVKTTIGSLLTHIRSLSSSIMEKVELIDLYEPENSDQKNATFRFTYRDTLQTISHETVEAEHKKFVDHTTKLLAK